MKIIDRVKSLFSHQPRRETHPLQNRVDRDYLVVDGCSRPPVVPTPGPDPVPLPVPELPTPNPEPVQPPAPPPSLPGPTTPHPVICDPTDRPDTHAAS